MTDVAVKIENYNDDYQNQSDNQQDDGTEEDYDSQDQQEEDDEECDDQQQNNGNQQNQQNNRNAGNNIESPKYIRLRGLPWSATHKEILDFLSSVDVVNGAKGIHLITSRWDGKNTGEAYVEVRRQNDVDEALKLNKASMGHRYIEVFAATSKEAREAMRKTGTHGASHVVKLRGLPYVITEQQVEEFFNGLDIKPDREGILFVVDKRGRRTGEAFVQFESQEDTEQALGRNREKIGHRYIEIFRSSLAELKRSVNGGGRVEPYDIRNRGSNRGGGSMNDFGGRNNMRGNNSNDGWNNNNNFGFGANNKLGFSSFNTGNFGNNFNNDSNSSVGNFGNFGNFGNSNNGAGNFGGNSGNFGNGGGAGNFGNFGNNSNSSNGFANNNRFVNNNGNFGNDFGDFGNFGNNRNNFNSSGGSLNDFVGNRSSIGNSGGNNGGIGNFGNFGNNFGNNSGGGGGGSLNLGNFGNNMGNNFGPIGGGRNDSDYYIVHMRGLPYTSFENDVFKFFDPLRPANVRINWNKRGLHSGTADAYFDTYEEAQSAMNRNREQIGTRYIELFFDGKNKHGPANNNAPSAKWAKRI